MTSPLGFKQQEVEEERAVSHQLSHARLAMEEGCVLRGQKPNAKASVFPSAPQACGSFPSHIVNYQTLSA